MGDICPSYYAKGNAQTTPLFSAPVHKVLARTDKSIILKDKGDAHPWSADYSTTKRPDQD